MSAPRKRVLHWAALVILLATLVAGAAGLYRMRKVEASGRLAAAPARQGEFLVIVRCRGELRARRSVQVNAPVNVPSLRIVWLAPPSSPVKQGEAVIRFDPSSARQQLQEKEAALKQAQASLEQAVAQARITAELDKRELSAARYAVERARLEASKAEIVSRLQGEVSRIDLGLAEQSLRVQQATVELHAASDKAKIASLTSQRAKAQAEVDLTNFRIAQMEVKAPLNGIIIYLPNYSQGWMNAKPFKVGDQVWPGAALGEIPDIDTLEMEGKVEEIDRGRVSTGQDARVRVDSLPELSLPARVGPISPLTRQNLAEWPPTRSFIGYAHLLQSDPRLRPGMNGSMDVVIQRIPDAISIPAKALFTRAAKPVVWLPAAGLYKAAEVEVLARNPDEVAVKGIPAGAMVALVEPEAKDRKP
ncbi:MAG TPA: HlyD family efflux transporter periplasmic adaptor subunit [Bryobacteraceae bacterium]|nr:HlyD family efflux transporter periplasmic adaptor subunit [Bryobacteraceae bacterium]